MPKEICPIREDNRSRVTTPNAKGDLPNEWTEVPTKRNFWRRIPQCRRANKLQLCDKIYHTDSSKDPRNKKNNCRRLSYTRAEFQVDWWQMITVRPKGSPQILTAKGSHPTKENLNKILPKEICPTIKPKFLSRVTAAKGDLHHVKSLIASWIHGRN